MLTLLEPSPGWPAELRPNSGGTKPILASGPAYRFGFAERMDSTASLLAALDSLKRQRILPP